MKISVLLFLILPLFSFTKTSAADVHGRIIDKTTSEPVANALVESKKSGKSTFTDSLGYFHLELDAGDVVIVSAYDVITTEFTVPDDAQSLWNIELTSRAKQIGVATITHNRQKEKLRESPITVESLTSQAIKETPASDFYEGLGHLRGVDVTAASMGFRIINTRGFNSTSPVRSLQLIDGVDNQAPGLNFSLGNFLGACELDVDNTEVIVGASSAYFGPNAFNGVINITSKSPWKYQGLSAQLKVGERELGQLMLRYAKTYKNHKGREAFAWKGCLNYMRAYDWVADNMDPTMDSKAQARNPGGYDAVNRYGDEVFGTASNDQVSKSSKVTMPGLGAFYRDGYLEKEIVNYNTRNLKSNLLFAYKFNSRNEIQYSFNFGTGTTVYQGDNRYSLNGILFFQNRLEWIGSNGHLRVYATHEDAGKTYDAVLTAFLMQDYAKSGEYWFSDYQNYWSSYIVNRVKNLPGYSNLGSPIPGNPKYNPKFFEEQEALLEKYRDSILRWHSLDRAQANSNRDYQGSQRPDSAYDRLTPGTPEFAKKFSEITSIYSYNSGGEIQGSRFFDRSSMYHATGEKRFRFRNYRFTTGFSSRMYKPYSKGTIFLDTGKRRITNMEAGVYAGVEKRVLHNRIKINATGRLDKNQNFNLLFSPAVSFIYSKTKNHTWRTSFSSAIRNPTLQDQYLHYNVGRAILLGNINGMKNVYQLQDFINYLNTQNRDTLKPMNVPAIKPEAVKTFEISYKGALLQNRLTFDAGYYLSYYTNFIGYRVVIDADIDDSLNLLKSAQAYRVASNSRDRVKTQGISLAASYFFAQVYMISSNWSWNVLDRMGSTDPLIPAFNTPRHKVNVMFGASDLNRKLNIGKAKIDLRNTGFNVNFKWVEGFRFEGSPQFTGDVPTYWTLDAQVSRIIPKWKSTLKLGASNLTNNKVFQVYGGPRIGRMAYFSITYEP